MDLESLRCFAAAAATLNFRAAARRVALSPGAFSDRLRRLEEELGVPLFVRTTRRAGRRSRAGPARREPRSAAVPLPGGRPARRVAVLPEYFVKDDLAAGRLRQLVPDVPLREDAFRLVWRAGHPLEDRLVALADELRERPLR